MKPRLLFLTPLVVLGVQVAYFFVSDGPFTDHGVPASLQLSGGNDDRFTLQVGTVLWFVPAMYGLVVSHFGFRCKEAIFIGIYVIALAIWAVLTVAVNFDTDLMLSVTFGDWFLPAYLAAPFVPLAVLALPPARNLS